MQIWHLCRTKYQATAFTGKGAAYFPGRWNHQGIPVVYCSAFLSLATLEQLVNLNRNRTPPEFLCFRIEIPDSLAIHEVRAGSLPENWNHPQQIAKRLREIGTDWVNSKKTAVFKIPSAIIHQEHNFLLNPKHDDFNKIKVGTPKPFKFNLRLSA